MKIQTGIPKKEGLYWLKGILNPCFFNTSVNGWDCIEGIQLFHQKYHGKDQWIGPLKNPFEKVKKK